MATGIIMPKQGQSVESCIITAWNIAVGDKVKKGDVLFSYETDKASFEETAQEDGTVLALLFEEGDDVECLRTVCVIGEEGEDISEFLAENKEEEEVPPQEMPPTPQVPQDAQSMAVIGEAGETLKISPRAKRLANQTGADLSKALPTGANNRVMERDVQALLNQGRVITPAAQEAYAALGQPLSGTGLGGRVTTFDVANGAVSPSTQSIPEQAFTDVRLSNIRKLIAKSMHASLANSAQLTLNSSFDATEILAYRKKLKAQEGPLSGITLNDMVLYATARALKKHPEVNAHFLEESMRLFHDVNLGVACDTDRGLMVPTLFAAQSLSLTELSQQSKALISACRAGNISPDSLTGGTFTVTNLGTLGVETFTPVLNPPQVGILGVCAVTQRWKNGEVYPAMGLSLTFDHRGVDGAPAARLLQEIVKNLENFSLLLAE